MQKPKNAKYVWDIRTANWSRQKNEDLQMFQLHASFDNLIWCRFIANSFESFSILKRLFNQVWKKYV